MDKDQFSGFWDFQISGCWKFRYMDFGMIICSNIVQIDLKWFHMARYELILRLDGALWPLIISGPLLTQKWFIKVKKWLQNPP